MKQVIADATRITSDTASFLDIIATGNNNNNLLIYIALFTCNDQERIPIHKI